MNKSHFKVHVLDLNWISYSYYNTTTDGIGFSSPGAYEEGVEGFFKGVGKGLLGLITKPTGGAVDMVSMAFDGIRR